MQLTPVLRQEPRLIPALVGTSKQAREIREFAAIAARTENLILLLGETGTGKDLLAKVIHCKSPQSEKEFVSVKCSGIPENLLETEFFGHTAGAFTDARLRKKGLFEVAEGGTIFINEVGDASASIQAKILGVVEEKTYRPIGGTQEIPVKARIIAATNTDLKAAVRAGKFRADLYYRLKVIEFILPPLRERKEDIPELVAHFLRQEEIEKEISSKTMDLMIEYEWPGNLRELKNALVRGTFHANASNEIRPEHLLPYFNTSGDAGTRVTAGEESSPPTFYSPRGELLPLEEMEGNYLRVALAMAHGQKNQAAKLMGIHRPTLYRWMEKYGLVSPKPPKES